MTRPITIGPGDYSPKDDPPVRCYAEGCSEVVDDVTEELCPRHVRERDLERARADLADLREFLEKAKREVIELVEEEAMLVARVKELEAGDA